MCVNVSDRRKKFSPSVWSHYTSMRAFGDEPPLPHTLRATKLLYYVCLLLYTIRRNLKNGKATKSEKRLFCTRLFAWTAVKLNQRKDFEKNNQSLNSYRYSFQNRSSCKNAARKLRIRFEERRCHAEPIPVTRSTDLNQTRGRGAVVGVRAHRRSPTPTNGETRPLRGRLHVCAAPPPPPPLSRLRPRSRCLRVSSRPR